MQKRPWPSSLQPAIAPSAEQRTTPALCQKRDKRAAISSSNVAFRGRPHRRVRRGATVQLVFPQCLNAAEPGTSNEAYHLPLPRSEFLGVGRLSTESVSSV